MNNFEKIKSMSIDEMSEFLESLLITQPDDPCSFCLAKNICNLNCTNMYKQWLESEEECQ